MGKCSKLIFTKTYFSLYQVIVQKLTKTCQKPSALFHLAIIYIMIIKGRFQILKGYQNNHVTIGFGSYGQVKLARDLQNGQIVAVKIINKIAKNEVMMHYGLSHHKIIKLLDVYIDTERQITYMILQYAEGGTLFDKIRMQTLTKFQIKQFFQDVCQGIAYLHSQNIMHRDIKPQNILLNKNNQAKLCDFGFAALLGQRKTLCGTYEYMSPEMIQNRQYDQKIDIWALGILLFELIAGRAPFRGERPEQVLEQMKTKIFFCDRFQHQDINLIKIILRVTPHKRPTIYQILNHPFFKNSDKFQDFANRSTMNTQEAKQVCSTLRYLHQSCNPKKIAEIQRFLECQQTYPPFSAQKKGQKISFGIPITINQSKQLKNFSPQHRQFTKNQGNNRLGLKIVTQASPGQLTTRNRNSPTVKGGIQNHTQFQTSLKIPINYLKNHKLNIGIGKAS